MKIVELIAKAIGKIWSFVATTICIASTATFVLFVIAVFFPDNIKVAIDIVKSLF